MKDYQLKQVLKSICGANHWSYAVLWKAGIQNPKLLIWEECYYEVMSSSNTDNGNRQLTLEELDMCWLTPGTCGGESGFGIHMKDKVQLLVNKMMMANQVHVIGEGLVGRTAFMGVHQWIVAGNYNGNGYPPEVINELNVQFSAGMQTIAVIPVIPLGVVQLGSSLAIMENIGFIHNVKDLILQLDRVPSAFLPNIPEYSKYIVAPNSEMTSAFPDTLGNMRMPGSGAMMTGGMKSLKDTRFGNDSSHPVLCEMGNSQQIKSHTFEVSTQNVSISQGDSSCQSWKRAIVSSDILPRRHYRNEYGGVQVIYANPDEVCKREPSLIRSGSGCSFGQTAESNYLQNPRLFNALQGSGIDPTSSSSTSVMTCQLNANEILYSDLSACWKAAGAELQLPNGNNNDEVVEDSPSSVIKQTTSVVVSGPSYSGNKCKPVCISAREEEKRLFNIGKTASASPSCEPIPDVDKLCGRKQCTNDIVEENLNQSSGGDDLFDIVGLEFKNKIMQAHYAINFNGNEVCSQMDELKKENFDDLTSFLNTKDDRFSESGIFSSSGSDDLLEAVICGIHYESTQSTDGDLSCQTTLTTTTSSVPISSSKFSPVNMSDSMYEMSWHTDPTPRSIEVGPSLIKSGFGKEMAWNIPQMSSSHGSRSSSRIEQGPVVNHESSIATVNSRKSAEFVGKPTNRKRLKTGESPRPRPKDRQMIQDRVKELREIIPNGAKCSIDSLLERTIKHMLFLQSVTKHVDKLKQVPDCKPSTEDDDGLLVKEEPERGATWVYEVGSQAMVCPIVVEDLNPPRQLLVKMLCEKNGFFLEIADMIRGMGLTILKGVMESRNDKVWARFAVEADRDVTRMEVFISLVHLLEQAAGKGNNAPADDDRLFNAVGFNLEVASSNEGKQKATGFSKASSDVLRARPRAIQR